MKDTFKPADIFLYCANDFLGKLINIFQTDKNEPLSIFSHAGLFINDNSIIEATITGVKCNLANKYLYEDNATIAVYRNNKLTDEQRRNIIIEALKFMNTKYAFYDIGIFFVDNIINRITGNERVLSKHIKTRQVTCAELVARAYAIINKYFFDIDCAVCEPDDIYDSIQRHKEDYELIYKKGRYA